MRTCTCVVWASPGCVGAGRGDSKNRPAVGPGPLAGGLPINGIYRQHADRVAIVVVVAVGENATWLVTEKALTGIVGVFLRFAQACQQAIRARRALRSVGLRSACLACSFRWSGVAEHRQARHGYGTSHPRAQLRGPSARDGLLRRLPSSLRCGYARHPASAACQSILVREMPSVARNPKSRRRTAGFPCTLGRGPPIRLVDVERWHHGRAAGAAF